MSRPEPIDITRCCPLQAVGFEQEGDRITLLRPRFMRGPLAWWLQPRLRRPFFHVRLDPLGSFVWQRCDGRTSIACIADSLEEHFKDQPQLLHRVVLFVRELERGKMIHVLAPDVAS